MGHSIDSTVCHCCRYLTVACSAPLNTRRTNHHSGCNIEPSPENCLTTTACSSFMAFCASASGSTARFSGSEYSLSKSLDRVLCSYSSSPCTADHTGYKNTPYTIIDHQSVISWLRHICTPENSIATPKVRAQSAHLQHCAVPLDPNSIAPSVRSH